MLWPGWSGCLSVMVPALRLELRPPPEVCAGGVSSVRPCKVRLVAVPTQGDVTVTVSPLEVTGRTSACAAPLNSFGVPSVVMCTTRNLSFVTGTPVLFKTVRRIFSVLVLMPFAVESVTRLGGVGCRAAVQYVQHYVRVVQARGAVVLRPRRAEFGLHAAQRRAGRRDEDEVCGVVVRVLRRGVFALAHEGVLDVRRD